MVVMEFKRAKEKWLISNRYFKDTANNNTK